MRDTALRIVRSASAEMERAHRRSQIVRGRGLPTQSQLSVLTYIRNLESEVDLIRKCLDAAWILMDEPKDGRKCARHLDSAQQRLHRIVRRLSKAGGRRRR